LHLTYDKIDCIEIMNGKYNIYISYDFDLWDIGGILVAFSGWELNQ